MQTKIIVKCSQSKKLDNNECWWGCGKNLEPSRTKAGLEQGIVALESDLVAFRKLNLGLKNDLDMAVLSCMFRRTEYTGLS